jgi:hypothetical protein
MTTLTPPPIRTPIETPGGGMHPVWQRWFIDLFRRAGGTIATPVDDLELALNMTSEPHAADVIDQDYTAPKIVQIDASLDGLFGAPQVAQPESLDGLFRFQQPAAAESLDGVFAAARDSEPVMRDDPFPVQRSEAHSGWNDILSDLSAGRGIGANAPTWTTLRDGIKAYAFDAGSMNEVWVNLHIMHDYLWGSKVWPHIHWTTAGTDTGVVRWGIEYTYARAYGVETFPATTTIYLEQAATGTPYTQMLAEPIEADGILLPNCEPDGVLMCRVFRDATHANDTCIDAAFGIFADLHFQSDGYLTNERNRGFTKRRV